MSDYHLVSTLHATLVALADADKAGDRDAVAAANAKVAAARAAVDAALADGRVMSSKHLLDLDLDCLGAILSHLGPEDALSVARVCTTLRSALFRGGLPGPLAVVCCKLWEHDSLRARAATAEAAALRALDAMEPARGALRLDLFFNSFDEGCTRMLARALDAAPRAARIDITLYCLRDDETGRLLDVLSSPDRAFASPPQVHVECGWDDSDAVPRLARAGVCVASLEQEHGDFSAFQNVDFMSLVAVNAINTLTELRFRTPGTIDPPTRFPALRRLILDTCDPKRVTINVPSLTALAPLLKEIVFSSIYIADEEDVFRFRDLPKHGFGFRRRRFARFVAAIDGVTRVCFGPEMIATLSQNEIENLGQLSALRTLRDLELSYEEASVARGRRGSRRSPPSAPVAEEFIANLPPLAPGLTRLAFSGSTRVAFGHPLPELRVLDWRDSDAEASCTSFYREQGEPVLAHDRVEQLLNVPLAIPSAALAPNLHTLLIGYGKRQHLLERPPAILGGPGDFDLWTLVAAPTALRVVVIENARLLCSAPGGFNAMAAGFDALLSREAKDLVAFHMHGCVIECTHQPVVDLFFHALEQRGVRVCRAAFEECLFCMLHDGSDLWARPRQSYNCLGG